MAKFARENLKLGAVAVLKDVKSAMIAVEQAGTKSYRVEPDLAGRLRVAVLDAPAAPVVVPAPPA